MLRDQPVGVAGKCHPDSGDQGDQSCFDPGVGREVSGGQEDEPHAGHQDHADEGAGTQPFHVPGVMADREDGKEQPRRVPDHGKQRLFIRQYGRQRKPPDHKRKQRHGEPENGGDGEQQELSAAVHAVHGMVFQLLIERPAGRGGSGGSVAQSPYLPPHPPDSGHR